jgi:hypothetical protein
MAVVTDPNNWYDPVVLPLSYPDTGDVKSGEEPKRHAACDECSESCSPEDVPSLTDLTCTAIVRAEKIEMLGRA